MARRRELLKESHGRRNIYGVASPRASGGTGRRAGFRFQWGNPSEFESLLAHQGPLDGSVRK